MPCVPFIFCRNDIPRCHRGRSQGEHVVERSEVVTPSGTVADVIHGHRPVFGGRDDPLTKAAKLLLIGNVQEQFDETDAIIDERCLEGVDLVIGPLPLFRARQGFDPFD